MDSSRWSRWITIATVLMLAAIAAVVSYSHMYELAQRHGEPEWRAALFPLSVDGMIVASSMALLADARQGRRGGLLPWTLLVLGSVASLAANIAVADPTVWSRIIHAWPSFALIGAYELLMREFRAHAHGVRNAIAEDEQDRRDQSAVPTDIQTPANAEEPGEAEERDDAARAQLRVVSSADGRDVVEARIGPFSDSVSPVQAEAWRWALAHRRGDGSLPSGREIAERFARKERWGRLVKQWGRQGLLDYA
ncbi:hypothetical protein HNR23_004990 [Nocardiopsis mwathae]|uniref:DUF2637 domain-containing protein n=1 Tax=Nocardiopsis mwathae TaxID=1472723 RepID=A0A7W9YMX7_9ACTN|nr:DUF2637 domain-containing protein [Nocardiopsis mwathae]MBB6174930.1 hypothetical protein [Nocardiopsis mwathae]